MQMCSRWILQPTCKLGLEWLLRGNFGIRIVLNCSYLYKTSSRIIFVSHSRQKRLAGARWFLWWRTIKCMGRCGLLTLSHKLLALRKLTNRSSNARLYPNRNLRQLAQPIQSWRSDEIGFPNFCTQFGYFLTFLNSFRNQTSCVNDFH
jgi:hypothetical protein